MRIAASKRGSHLALSLERLQALCGAPLMRIGLSATQKPIDEVARFLVGAGAVDGWRRRLRDRRHRLRHASATWRSNCRPRRSAPVMSNEQWEQVYDARRRAGARSIAPRWSSSTPGAWPSARRATWANASARSAVAAHHGSLAQGDAPRRRAAAQARRAARCWWPPRRWSWASTSATSTWSASSARRARSPPSCSARPLRPRGRRHAQGAPVPAVARRTGRMRGAARLRAPRRARRAAHAAGAARRAGAADRRRGRLPRMAARTRCSRWCAAPGPTRNSTRDDFDAVVRMLSEGFTTRHGTARRLPASRRRQPPPARAHGRAPDRADLRRHHSRQPATTAVVLEPQAHNDRHASTRTSRSRAWPATSSSSATPATASCGSSRAACGSRTRRARRPTFRSGWARRRAAATNCPSACRGCAQTSAQQLAASRHAKPRVRLAARQARPGRRRRAPARRLPGARTRLRSARCRRRTRIVMERFFDESGGMQLVIHSPFGSRINRAWGLALRKRFCRKFNFELQAAATEDAIVLSLSTSHSFPLDEVARYLHSATALDVLVQALLDAPLFGVRWRWNADHRAGAAALRRRPQGRAAAAAHEVAKTCWPRCSPTRSPAPRTSPANARSPSIRWSRRRCDDCLHEAMDADGWLRAAARASKRGEVRVHRARPARALAARGRSRSTPGPTPSSTMRRWKSAARRPCRTAATTDPQSSRRPRPLDADAIDARARRSLARSRATPTRCTRR